jgi:hypothetical protein
MRRNAPLVKAVVAALFAAGEMAAATQEKIALPQVLARAGAYVEEFQRQLSNMVAEETYLQEVVPFLGSNARGSVRYQRRNLKSDLLLLRPENSTTWVQFRDVFEVDGKPVRDREERLSALFLAPTATTADRANEIRAESARYNIGAIERTLNVPVLPLVILSPQAQPRFRFKVDVVGEKRAALTAGLPAGPSFRVSTEVWVIRFEEETRPTIVHTDNGADIMSRGRFWIEPSSGRVLMSEMITEDADVRAQINVSYQSEPLSGMLVPIEMREKYRSTQYRATINGEATYGRFRRFQVAVDERLAPIR